MGEVVGRVVALNRYPVKSMQGEAPRSVDFDETGMLGDRDWGVIEADSGKLLSAKRVGRLLDARAVADPAGGTPLVTLPDGSTGAADDPATSSRLSDWLERHVDVRSAVEYGGASYEMSFNIDDQEADRFEIPTPTTRFVDLTPAHLLTTASIRAAAALHPTGNWDPNRFRPPILIELDDGADGFVENGWIDQPVAIGTAVFNPILPTVRCVMTTRAQVLHGLERDLDIFRTMVTHNEGNLGVYTTVTTSGTVSVGDPVAIG